MISIFIVLGDFNPWKMSLSLTECSSGNKVTRCFMGQASKQWRKTSWNYFRYSWSRIWWEGRGRGMGGMGGGGCFTYNDSDECQLTIKHKYRRDCLDSPMCVPNIKNLQGVNKCFMWNWKTERRKDEVPDPRKQALRWGSKANHRLTEWDVINTKDWGAPINEDRLRGQNCYGNQPQRQAMWCDIGSPLEKMSL